MSENSKIEWTDSTWNPWEGCTKVGPGCDNCYAENRNARFGGGQAVNWGPGAPRRRTSVANWNMPSKWNKEHAAFFAEHGRRRRVFCASLADVFDNEVDQRWRDEAFHVMESTPNLDWLVLTKRVGNVRKMVPAAWLEPGGWPVHIRIGATIVDQEEFDRDAQKLVALGCPNFLSMEPLRSYVAIWRRAAPHCERHPGKLNAEGKCSVCEGDGIWGLDTPLTEAEKAPIRKGIDWVIVGGESGPRARPMHPDWARGLRDQCAAAGVPFLFKQWGEWAPGSNFADHIPSGTSCDFDEGLDADGRVWKVGKKVAGRHLDGRTHDGFPTRTTE